MKVERNEIVRSRLNNWSRDVTKISNTCTELVQIKVYLKVYCLWINVTNF